MYVADPHTPPALAPAYAPVHAKLLRPGFAAGWPPVHDGGHGRQREECCK